MAKTAQEMFDEAFEGVEARPFTDERPPFPSPDASKPYMWLDGRWVLILKDDPEDYEPTNFAAVRAKALSEGSGDWEGDDDDD